MHHAHRGGPSQVSASSPNLSYAGGPSSSSSASGAPSVVGSHEAGSAPSLSSAGQPRVQLPFRVLHPNELARRLACCPVGHPVAGPLPVIVDCRPFTEYNKCHVRGAVHINCSDKISRRRLQQGKVTVLELVSCREAKDSFRGGVFSRDLVVYDESTSDPARLATSQPLHVVLESLRREGKDPIVLKGRRRITTTANPTPSPCPCLCPCPCAKNGTTNSSTKIAKKYITNSVSPLSYSRIVCSLLSKQM